MQTRTEITPVTVPTRGPRRQFIKRLFGLLVEYNRKYRAAHKLRNMPEERLRDMGITREEANRAFWR